TVGLGGKSQLELGDTAFYGMGLYSLTNVTAPYVHLEVGVPRLASKNTGLIPGEALVLRGNLVGAPQISDVPWADLDPIRNLSGEQTATGFTYDFVNRGYAGLTFSVETYPELKRLLAEDPKFLANLFDFELESLAFNFAIYAAATPMTADEYVAYQKAAATTAREKILADATAPSSLRAAVADAASWEAGWLAALTDAGLLRPEDEPPAIRQTAQFDSLMAVVAAGMLGAPAGATLRSSTAGATALADFFTQVRAWYGHDPAANGTESIPTADQFDLHLTSPTHFEAFKVQVGTGQLISETKPSDPSLSRYATSAATSSTDVSLSGPSGFGDDNVVPAATPLPFVVELSNPSSAARAVTQLRVVQTLDDGFDVRSFRLGDILLGDLQIHIPSNRATFSGQFDLVEQTGFQLSVTAGVDVVTRTAFWTLTAIDPDTGLPLTSTTSGLLAPGQRGVIGYAVKANPAATTGTSIESVARVFFNSDAARLTNTVAVSLDAAAPTTSYDVAELGAGSYRVSWTTTDDTLGSGVKDSTVYASVDDGPYFIYEAKTNNTSLIYTGVAGETVRFLVLSSDNAGNVETGPDGVDLPPYLPSIQLGNLPTATEDTSEDLPVTPPSTVTPTNPVFLAVQRRVPASTTGERARAADFSTIYEPLSASAFAWGFADSGAGISPLGIAFSADGRSIYVSGGAGRNELYRFGVGGGQAVTPLATLDVPLYDMLVDANGLLWATTGGGPLVQLDPDTGEILNRYSDGVTLGMAAIAGTSQFYVATSSGVQRFDSSTGKFSPFSSTRVDGLAIAPDGSLWGATWPHDGQIVKFDSHGRATVMLDLGKEAEGLAFGQTDTPLAGLLFVSHTDGTLTLVDVASLKATTLASGGSRGDFLHVSPDGRVYVTQSNEIDVLSPVTPPRVVATTPIGGANLSQAIREATVTFDVDMLESSVTNPANYRIRNLTNNVVIDVGGVSYDPGNRTARLQFEALPQSRYALVVDAGVVATNGEELPQAYSAEFSYLADFSAVMPVTLSTTRLNRIDGTVDIDVSATNGSTSNVGAPIRFVLTGLTKGDAGPQLANPTGYTSDGHPYVDVAAADAASELAPGAHTATHTLTIVDETMARFDLGVKVFAQPQPNAWPTFNSQPVTSAAVGGSYQYSSTARDSGGEPVAYVLVNGPTGASVDATTGVVSWTPTSTQAPRASFELRAYDPQGGYARQRWTVAVTDSNIPPVLSPIDDQSLVEGENLSLTLGAFDANGDALVFGVDNLPPGAVFDQRTHRLHWGPEAGDAGRYSDVTAWVSDGRVTVSRMFSIVVGESNQPPTVQPATSKSMIEGDTLVMPIRASDPDGDSLVFTSPDLPIGATLNPVTGVLRWPIRYDQHGEHLIHIDVTDGQSTATTLVNVSVSNVNAPVRFEPLEHLVVYETQTLDIRIVAVDPDQPGAAIRTLVTSDELTSETGGVAPTFTVSSTGLPSGATFDATTHILHWVPSAAQAGVYRLTFNASDDGDGTGTPTSNAMTVEIEVRDANATPVVDAIANRSTPSGGAALDVPVRATDADDLSGATLRLFASGLPSYATFVDNHDGTGVIHFAPTLADRGNQVITVTATDNGNGDARCALTGAASFVFTAQSDNAQPRLATIGDKVAVVGKLLSFFVNASDVDQDDLTFAAQGLPAGATIAPSGVYGQAIVSWTPTAGQLGAYDATFRVQDSGNNGAGPILSDQQAVRLVVRNSNSAPTLRLVPPQTIAEGGVVTVNLSATDADGDALTFTGRSLPANASVDPRTGVFRFAPDYDQEGSYTVRLLVSDGNLTTTQDVPITVTRVNRAPVLAPLPDLLTQEGIPLNFTVGAHDPDADPLSFSVVADTLPPGATFDPANQSFSWTPGFDAAGLWQVRFEVADPAGATGAVDVNLQVLNVNRPPVIPLLGARQLPVDQTFVLPLGGTDPDSGTALTYSIDGLPFGATFDSGLQAIRWTPAASQIGQYDLTVTVSDGDLQATQPVTLLVVDQPTPPAVLIEFTPSFAVQAGQAVLVHVAATSVADIASLSVTIDGAPVTLDAFGRARYVTPRPGRIGVSATAIDVDGVSASLAKDLKVRDPADRTAPSVAIDVPSSHAILDVPIDVTGSVVDQNLDSWTLEIAPLGSEQ
ncbi:MAG TPA: putative Ig domain-containing protein, partial [Pirellulaceae bacterium]|nr:putative Ig domain-containing protein [Pirellulaceae bacterium]